MRAIEHFEHTVSWARAHERHLSAISLAGGFAFDSYAFGRIDRPMTQAVFIIYLLVAGTAIAVLHALESRPDDRKPLRSDPHDPGLRGAIRAGLPVVGLLRLLYPQRFHRRFLAVPVVHGRHLHRQ